MCCLFGSQKLKSKKHYLIGKNIFEVIFPMFFWDENFKTCLACYFPALETLSTTSAAAKTVTSTSTTPSTIVVEFSIAHFDRWCMWSNASCLHALLNAAPGHHGDDGDDDEDDGEEMDAEQRLHY